MGVRKLGVKSKYMSGHTNVVMPLIHPSGYVKEPVRYADLNS